MCPVALNHQDRPHSHIFTLVDSLPPLFFSFFPLLSSLPSAFFLCPVTEPSVWTDCDIGCVGDRLAGVISEGEKNRSASLYLTPFPLPLAFDEERNDERYCKRRKKYSYFSKGGFLTRKAKFVFKVSQKCNAEADLQPMRNLSGCQLGVSPTVSAYLSLLHIITSPHRRQTVS